MKILLSLLAVLLLATAPHLCWARNVGFQQVAVSNGADRPLVVGVWYPTDAPAADTPLGTFTQAVAPGAPVQAGPRLPLVVMSHGNGGWYGEHYDTALELARAGFVVAAVSHTGDTYDDQSRATRMVDRPAHMKRLIDYMLTEWSGAGRLDPARIGAFGFSSGGFTVLVAAGGTPDLTLLAEHCRLHPGYYDCGVLKRAGAAGLPAAFAAGGPWTHDGRIRAAVVVAPALGFTFGKAGLAGVGLPIQLWRDLDDHVLPNPDYAEAVRVSLPAPPETHLVEHADHFDFLAPCTARLAASAPLICRSEPGFDRAAFHTDFDREVVRFLLERLP